MTGFDEEDDDDVEDFTNNMNIAQNSNNNNQYTATSSIQQQQQQQQQQTLENNRIRVNLPNRSELNHCLSRIRLFCLNHYGKFEHDLKLLNELEVKINRNITH